MIMKKNNERIIICCSTRYCRGISSCKAILFWNKDIAWCHTFLCISTSQNLGADSFLLLQMFSFCMQRAHIDVFKGATSELHKMHNCASDDRSEAEETYGGEELSPLVESSTEDAHLSSTCSSNGFPADFKTSSKFSSVLKFFRTTSGSDKLLRPTFGWLPNKAVQLK